MHAAILTWFVVCQLADFPKPGEWAEQVKFKSLGGDRFTAADFDKFGWSGWRNDLPPLSAAAESFVVHVPRNYDGSAAFGLLVYISPGQKGMMQGPKLNRKQLTDVLEKNRLMYVGLNNAGNRRPMLERVELAMAAVKAMKASGRVDESRVIAAGLSGGGKIASIAAKTRPQVFHGAISVAGVTPHRLVPAGNGAYFQLDIKVSDAHLKRLRAETAFAVISGPKDRNYESSKRIEQSFHRDRLRSRYFDVPELGHELPDPETLNEAIGFLLQPSEPKPAKAKVRSK